MEYKFEVGVVGGTFDHLHKGHLRLLQKAYTQSKKLYIGLATGDLLSNKMFPQSLQSYKTRKRHLESYLSENSVLDRCTIVPIHDLYGNTITEPHINGIFVTEETKKAVPLINTKRLATGMPKLKQIIVPYVVSDDQTPISSERIRKGEITREGFVFANLFSNKNDYILPDSMRISLRKPFGSLFIDISFLTKVKNDSFIVTVGDIVTLNVLRNQNIPVLSIFDLKTKRETLTKKDKDYLLSLPGKMLKKNHRASLMIDACLAIKTAFEMYYKSTKQQILQIDGEEDLLVIPAILFAPLEAIVLYGKYDQGVVAVKVTENKKEQMRQLLTQFL